MDTLRYYLPGIILILIAIMVVAVPEILVVFVASIIIIVGISALLIGHKIRKLGIDLSRSDDRFFDDDFLGLRFVRRPVFREWIRWF